VSGRLVVSALRPTPCPSVTGRRAVSVLSPSELTERIVQKARSLGASLVGVAEAVMSLPPAGDGARYGVKYCRNCELSCPVGR
jgi:hypothetical protein